MKSQYKLGQTYRTKDNELTRELDMNNEYNVVIQEKSETKNLIVLAINSRKKFVETTTRFYDGPDNYYEEAEIRAMDILHDEICIKDNKTGTVIYGDAIMHLGENKIIEFTPYEDDLIANVQFEIETISGERVMGYLYCTHKPKNFYL